MGKWDGYISRRFNDRDTTVPNEVMIRLLDEQQLSCRALARLIDMGEVDMHYMKRGEMIPDYKMAKKVAAALKSTPENIWPVFKDMPESLKPFFNLPGRSKPCHRKILDKKIAFMKQHNQIPKEGGDSNGNANR